MADNVQLAKDLLTAMATQDKARIIPLLAEDAVWHTPPSTMPPYPGPHRGRAAVLNFLTGAGGALFEKGSIQVAYTAVVADSDQVAIQCRLKARTVAGFDYENQYAFFFRCANGQIAEVWENADTAYVYGRFGIEATWVERGVPAK